MCDLLFVLFGFCCNCENCSAGFAFLGGWYHLLFLFWFHSDHRWNLLYERRSFCLRMVFYRFRLVTCWFLYIVILQSSIVFLCWSSAFGIGVDSVVFLSTSSILRYIWFFHSFLLGLVFLYPLVLTMFTEMFFLFTFGFDRVAFGCDKV